MRIAFETTEARFEADEYALVCAFQGRVGDRARYLVLQRSAESEPADEDWGVHIEYGDQATGQYDAIRSCTVSRSRLAIDLSASLPTLSTVEGFELALRIPDATYAEILAGLRRIFRGTSAVLLDIQST